jgi:chromosomal replication initiator protein
VLVHTVWRDMRKALEPTFRRHASDVEAHPSSSRWDEFQHRLRSQVNTSAWQTWLKPLTPHLANGVLTLQAPNQFHLQWVEDRFLPAIEESGRRAFGNDTEIALAALETPEEPSELRIPRPLQGPPPQPPVQDRDSRLVAKYTFENFVVGPSNRFAHAAAMAVAEQPGSHYNPLFIYGGAGLGKTHLMHAVGHHRRELAPRSVVKYVSSEQFFNEFINGIRRKRMDEFKARYRTIDVLLLDDVQFFERKEQILEEFFHTFNSLYEAGKQLVISADRPPKHLSTLEDRLRSRFEWGLLTDIQPPDVETRLAILRKNAEFSPMPVPKDVLGFIAEHVLDNIRELEGALTRVTAFAALTHQQITLQMSHEVLKDLVPDETRTITADIILEATAITYGLTTRELIGPSRKQPLARYRQIAMYLCRELTDLSLPKIGAAFGGRDHTTVIHAIERVKGLIQKDKTIFDQVTVLTKKVRTT